MISKQFLDKDRQLDNQKFVNPKSIEQASTYNLKKTQFYGEALKRLKGKIDFINKCLELQDSVNCFIDSSRSSKTADKDIKGVRQILQKK